jgi:hypothetical protein
MRVTPSLRKSINRAVRRLVGGFSPLAEVGVRANDAGQWVANGLNWAADADLEDLHRLSEVTTIDDHAALPGCATLDLYVTAGRGHEREAQGNVYVVIKDGVVVDAHVYDLGADARCIAVLGVPFCKGRA